MATTSSKMVKNDGNPKPCDPLSMHAIAYVSLETTIELNAFVA